MQFAIITFYFKISRKSKDIKIFVGSALIFGLVDLFCSIVTTIFGAGLNLRSNNIYLLSLVLEVAFVLLIVMNKDCIYKLLTNQNGIIFVELIVYIYISTMVVYFFTVRINRMLVVFAVSLSLLILQIMFSILVYSAAVKIQKHLLTKQEQKEQKFQLELANADRKAKEAENKELILKQQQLSSEMEQLQEYSNYLDKNEDDLHRFKHDYQNILNGLKVSAQEGNTAEVVKILDQYTETQFNKKALRKYNGVNHIHEKNLKSIAIAKLSKLYSLELDYSFNCEQDIFRIPNSVNILDLVRIIGIAFDNAAEESQALIKETDNSDSARIDAMYYQENGDFEFEIRNRVRKNSVATDKISQKNYTTKKHHMGLGLSNVKEIAHKYEDSMIVNYYVDDGWFTFDLTILPDDESEAKK
ncbi:GHKL domain-containing protein [Lactobacillus crispatus]|nr:GHKL domain-containing protein [Lactobacillus crispatus]